MSIPGYKHQQTGGRARLAGLLVIALSLSGMWPIPPIVHAMDPEQLASLPGTELLDMRVDAVLRQCGLPVAIDDAADAAPQRQPLRWNAVRMNLSALNWTIHYSRSRAGGSSGSGWRNPEAGSLTCLTGLSALVLHAKGEAGFLATRKRPDNNGYITTYTVPDDLFNAHQIVGIAGRWKQGRPVSGLHKIYGVPDEVLEQADGGSIHRYWIIHRENKMPLSAHAIDFEFAGPTKNCHNYAVYTNGTGFVQEKLDTLIRQWEKVYVLD